MLSGRSDDSKLYSARERPAVYGGVPQYARALLGDCHEVGSTVETHLTVCGGGHIWVWDSPPNVTYY